MLRIKDFENNRNKLLNYGFKYIETQFYDFYVYEKEDITRTENIEIIVDTKRGFIYFGDNYVTDYKWFIPNVIYDLIKDGIIIKEKEYWINDEENNI